MYELTHLLGEARPTPGTSPAPRATLPVHALRAHAPRTLNSPALLTPIPFTPRMLSAPHTPAPVPFTPRTTPPRNALHAPLTLSRSRSEVKTCTSTLNRSHARLRAHSPPSHSGTRARYHYPAQTSTTTTTRTPHTLAYHAPRTRPPHTTSQGKQKRQYNSTISPTTCPSSYHALG